MTTDQIEQLKKEHKEVFELEVEGRKAWLKKPDRKIVAMAQSLGNGSQIEIAELLMDACWLGGDEAIRTDDELFLSAFPVLNQLIEVKAASLKKI